jgi:hypothetical protein
MTIEKRLDRLERENRMLKGAGAVALLVLLAVAVMGASQQEVIPDVVKARAEHSSWALSAPGPKPPYPTQEI